MSTTALRTRPDTDAPIRLKGMVVTPWVTARDTHGLVSVLEQSVEPGAGSPPHRCTKETKVIAVLEGSFEVLHGTERVAAGAGDCVVVEPGVRHNFTNAGSAPGRVLVTLTPGGHEDFLRGLADLGGPGNADPVELAAHCTQFGVDLRS